MTRSQWCVSCFDPFGRDRSLTVVTTQEHVLLTTPAGQSAVLSVAQVKQLDAALTLALARLAQIKGDTK